MCERKFNRPFGVTMLYGNCPDLPKADFWWKYRAFEVHYKTRWLFSNDQQNGASSGRAIVERQKLKRLSSSRWADWEPVNIELEGVSAQTFEQKHVKWRYHENLSRLHIYQYLETVVTSQLCATRTNGAHIYYASWFVLLGFWEQLLTDGFCGGVVAIWAGTIQDLSQPVCITYYNKHFIMKWQGATNLDSRGHNKTQALLCENRNKKGSTVWMFTN